MRTAGKPITRAEFKRLMAGKMTAEALHQVEREERIALGALRRLVALGVIR